MQKYLPPPPRPRLTEKRKPTFSAVEGGCSPALAMPRGRAGGFEAGAGASFGVIENLVLPEP